MVGRSHSRIGTSANQIISGKSALRSQTIYIPSDIDRRNSVLSLRYDWHKSVIEILKLVSGETCSHGLFNGKRNLIFVISKETLVFYLSNYNIFI